MAKRKQKETDKLNHSTVAEHERRVNMVYEMLLSGLSRYEITANLEKQGIKVTYRQTTNYISNATKLINQDYIENREAARNKFLAQYNLLLKKCILSKDFKTAASILEKQSKMIGVYEPSDNNISNNTLKIEHTFVDKKDDDDLDFTL